MAEALFPWEKHLATGKRLGRAAVRPANAVLPFPLAQEIGTRQYLWLRVCPTCQKRKLYQARQGTCSRSCGQSLRAWRCPRDERKMRAIHKLAVDARIRNREARLLAECEGLTAREAYRKGYERGYSSGHAAHRKGCRRLGAA